MNAILKPEPRHTWQDYQTWPDSERWELIDGVAVAMAPAPSIKHQTVAGRLYASLLQRLNGKPCKPFIAPIDVHLSDLDVVQPDVLVVCNPSKITPSHIEGAPEVVVEVLDTPSATLDLREKMRLYERSGVAEYCVVSPMQHFATRYLNSPDGFDKGTVFGPDEMLVIATLENLEIPLWEVFELPGPSEAASPGQ